MRKKANHLGPLQNNLGTHLGFRPQVWEPVTYGKVEHDLYLPLSLHGITLPTLFQIIKCSNSEKSENGTFIADQPCSYFTFLRPDDSTLATFRSLDRYHVLCELVSIDGFVSPVIQPLAQLGNLKASSTCPKVIFTCQGQVGTGKTFVSTPTML